jgi:hypothetical protein
MQPEISDSTLQVKPGTHAILSKNASTFPTAVRLTTVQIDALSFESGM